MALRWKNFVPNTPVKASEVNDLANNGIVQVDVETDLDSADLVNANLAFALDTFTLWQRIAAGVGADKWQKAALTPSFNKAYGGAISEVPNYDGAAGQTWRVHRFESNDTFTIAEGGQPFRVLLIGGGGGGNSGSGHGGNSAGGGAASVTIDMTATLTAGAYPVVVGQPGANGQDSPNGSDGGASSIATFTAAGGGAGAGRSDQVNPIPLSSFGAWPDPQPLAQFGVGSNGAHNGVGWNQGGNTHGLVVIAYRVA